MTGCPASSLTDMAASDIRLFRQFVLYTFLLSLCAALELEAVRPGQSRAGGKTIGKRDVTDLDLRNFETFLWEAESKPYEILALL